MKKVDLHLHTVPSLSDSQFDFSLEKLKEYVTTTEIDCIAITNHNLFDKSQFETITSSLSINVLPGIEIDLEGGHILLISDNKDLDEFSDLCDLVTAEIKTNIDTVLTP